MSDRVPIRNPEGYIDMTAHDAIQNVMREEAAAYEEADNRNNRLIKLIRAAVELAGFELVSRVEVRDRKTGRVYR